VRYPPVFQRFALLDTKQELAAIEEN